MLTISSQSELARLHRTQIELRKQYELCGVNRKVAITPQLMLKLESDTLRLDANPRPTSSAGNVDNLVEMRRRGISILSNPKGAMLIGKKDGCYVITDGLHTYRSYLQLAKLDGVAAGNYECRLQFLTPDEQIYFGIFGDGNFKPRPVTIMVTLRDSKGKLVIGALKNKQCQIASRLHSYSKEFYGGDARTGTDQAMAFHEKYRAEIEFVTSFSKLMALKKSRENNAAVLAVFCDAIHRIGEPVKALFRAYATLNYTCEQQPHAAHLLSWVRDQELGVRAKQQRLAFGVSFWIHAYVLGFPADRPNGKPVNTGVTQYLLPEAERKHKLNLQNEEGRQLASKMRLSSRPTA